MIKNKILITDIVSLKHLLNDSFELLIVKKNIKNNYFVDDTKKTGNIFDFCGCRDAWNSPANDSFV